MYTTKAKSNLNIDAKNKTSKSVTAQRKTIPAMDRLKSGQLNSLRSNMHEEMTKTADVESTAVQEKSNQTGLPDRLKNGIESLSGYSMDDVRVHYNSPKPAQLQSLAYAQGNEIHVAPGQEKHLGHEAWHVVQQKQGRVAPAAQMKGININNDRILEREADVMGAKAIQMKNPDYQNITVKKHINNNVAQRFTKNNKQYNDLASYYNSLEKKSNRKKYLTAWTKIFPDILENTDISDCSNWNQIKKKFEDQMKIQFNQNIPETTKILFDKFKENMKVNMNENMNLSDENNGNIIFFDYSSNYNYYSKIQELYGSKLGTKGDNKGIFNFLFHHYNLERDPEPPDPAHPIIPEDITMNYNSLSSCVITALFKAEEKKIKATFGANSVEDLHNFLVKCFTDNKYSVEQNATPHQKNNVWKNYSDDSVYPSMYEYFDYKQESTIPQNPQPTQNQQNQHIDNSPIGKYLKTAINNKLITAKKGMIIIKGHAIYFQNNGDENNPAIELYDNENRGAIPYDNFQGEDTKIEEIYYK